MPARKSRPEPAKDPAPSQKPEPAPETAVTVTEAFSFVNPHTGELVELLKGAVVLGPLADYLLRADPDKVKRA